MSRRNCVGFAVLILFFATACKSGRPVRKTLPDELNESQDLALRSWEMADGRPLPGTQKLHPVGNGELPFYFEETVIKGKPCTEVFLPNPRYDSLVWSIIRSYEPFAETMLNVLESQGVHNVAIDVGQYESSWHGEAEFSVSNRTDEASLSGKSRKMNVVILWDKYSAGRAEALINELKSTPLLSVRELSNTNPYSSNYRQDCFSGSAPSLDEQ